MFALVTLTWNAGDSFWRLARSVVKYTTEPFTWIVVENGSKEEHRRLVDQAVAWMRTGINLGELPYLRAVHTIYNERNLGIPVGMNQAFDLMDAEIGPWDVILADHDVEILDPGCLEGSEVGWSQRMRQLVRSDPRVGIVGAIGRHAGGSPVYYNEIGHWYRRDDMLANGEGEMVEFSLVLFAQALMERGLRFDEGYRIYDGCDQDLGFRVRSWGYTIHSLSLDIRHYGQQAMKDAEYQWDGGGWEEWELMRIENQRRFRVIWNKWLRPRRPSVTAEAEHVQAMNAALVAEAGWRKDVPLRQVRG